METFRIIKRRLQFAQPDNASGDCKLGFKCVSHVMEYFDVTTTSAMMPTKQERHNVKDIISRATDNRFTLLFPVKAQSRAMGNTADK